MVAHQNQVDYLGSMNFYHFGYDMYPKTHYFKYLSYLLYKVSQFPSECVMVSRVFDLTAKTRTFFSRTMITSRSKFCEHVNIYKHLTTFVLIRVTVYTMYERHARQYILIWDSFQPIVPRLPIRYKAVQSFSIWHYSITCVTAAHVSRK